MDKYLSVSIREYYAMFLYQKTHRAFHPMSGILNSGGVSSLARGDAWNFHREHEQRYLEHHHPLAPVSPHHSQDKACIRPPRPLLSFPQRIGGEGEDRQAFGKWINEPGISQSKQQ